MSAIAISALQRCARPLGALALAIALPVMAVPSAHAQTFAGGLEMCWSAEALAFKEGEDRIRRGAKLALVAPPSRTPIAAEPLPPDERRVIRRVKLPPGVKLVALTFDLCEPPYEIAGYQGRIVDYLREHRIKATFFAGGKWMLTHKVRAEQLMSDALFEVGNHAWEHRNLRLLKGPALVQEIESAQTAYEQVRRELAARQCLGRDGLRTAHRSAPVRLSLFRFPFGACNDLALEAVGAQGLKAIQWDVASGDPWIGQTPEMIVKAVLARARPGSIIVFHANGRGWHTASALPEVVRALEARGYGFATVSELLARGEPEYSPICYDRRPGDTDRYDALALSLDKAYAFSRQKALSGPTGPEAGAAPVPSRKPAAAGGGFKTETRRYP
jgi:peptidoglycan/xylan/chitin deacetylase (PgdA/CDA1 family)